MAKKQSNWLDKYPDGGTITPKDFTLQLINSPRYKERLSGQGYINPSEVVKTRNNLVNKTNVFYQDNTPSIDQIKTLKANKTPYSTAGSRYDRNNIVIDRGQVKELGIDESAAEVHEFSHPETQDITKGGYEVPGLNINDRLQLYKRLRIPFKNPKVYTPTAGHDLDPTENKADMNALRYQLYKKGVDIFNKDITPQNLQDLKSSDDFSTKRLFEHYEDKDLLWLLNNIAYNQNSNNSNNITVAKNGVELKKLDELTNFTNYNKNTKGGWLSKYE